MSRFNLAGLFKSGTCDHRRHSPCLWQRDNASFDSGRQLYCTYEGALFAGLTTEAPVRHPSTTVSIVPGVVLARGRTEEAKIECRATVRTECA
jgi:hypothetical protein